MSAQKSEKLFMAGTVADAVAALADHGADGAPFAGGTWIMRAPIRQETKKPFYVGIGRLDELRVIDQTPTEIRIGACATHTEVVAALAGVAPCTGLVAAAKGAANPAIRQMATVGGNLSAWDFPASDLPPALLCLDASIELRTPGGQERLSIDAFLEKRQTLAPGSLVTGVIVPRHALRCGHARLPLRKAGDYPAAIVSMAAALSKDGRIETIKIAVGSVEATARRWPQLEQQLIGRSLEPVQAHALAEREVSTFTGRDGVEAPGWYRVQVLPVLVRRAAEALLASA